MAVTVSTVILRNGTPAVDLVAGDTLNLLATGLLLVSGIANGVNGAGGNTFNISGDIISQNAKGIESLSGNVFNITATATVFGLNWAIFAGGGNTLINAGDLGAFTRAVQFLGAGNTINNSGNIRSGDGEAVLITATDNSITNSGYMDGGGVGLRVTENNNTLVNTGTIRGGTEGVDFDGPGGVNAFFNSGTVIGGLEEGYDGAEGRDVITNNGRIQGATYAVDLAGGNDVYDGRNGTIAGGTSGGVFGGTGDDIIYGGSGGENLQGGDANDQLSGGGGGDTILGGAGIDLILGGAGGDVIQGGLGIDLFGFNVGDNGDLIQNFNEGGARDGFDLRGYFNVTGYTGTTPRAAGIMQVLQNGADTDVYLHGAFAFRIQAVVAAAIDDSYFLFQ